MGVDPRGSSFTSPRGVNTYTSSGKSSTFTVFRNSRGSFISFCSSRIWRSHTNIWSPLLSVTCFLLVPPVRRDPVLRQGVHLLGPDLDLHHLGVGTEHGGMQGLVEVRLRHRDVVLEPARDRPPEAVHDAKRLVTLPYRPGDDTEPDQVVDVIEVDPLARHLVEDARDVL